MAHIKTASRKSGSQNKINKILGYSLQQNYLTKEKTLERYPYSNWTVKLSPHCHYCGYQTGLVIVRWHDDLGFVRCCRCDSALFSIAETKKTQGLTHIGTVLDNYLPTLAGFSEVAS